MIDYRAIRLVHRVETVYSDSEHTAGLRRCAIPRIPMIHGARPWPRGQPEVERHE